MAFFFAIPKLDIISFITAIIQSFKIKKSYTIVSHMIASSYGHRAKSIATFHPWTSSSTVTYKCRTFYRFDTLYDYFSSDFLGMNFWNMPPYRESKQNTNVTQINNNPIYISSWNNVFKKMLFYNSFEIEITAATKTVLATKVRIKDLNCHFSCKLTTQTQQSFFEGEKFMIFLWPLNVTESLNLPRILV